MSLLCGEGRQTRMYKKGLRLDAEGKQWVLSVAEEEDGAFFYCLRDIGRILENPGLRLHGIAEKDLRVFPADDYGGRSSETRYANKNALRVVLARSRSAKAAPLARVLGIDLETIYLLPIETQTLDQITTAFAGETMSKQHGVGPYRIDLYFPDYKLAIECDEDHHRQTVEADRQREDYIRGKLGCTFLRYRPFEPGFDPFRLINQVYRHIRASSPP